jgi:hypothetical protein
MDRSNLYDLQRLRQRKPEGKAKVMLFGEHSGGKVEVVEDPYYGGKEEFEIAYEQCMRFSKVSVALLFSAGNVLLMLSFSKNFLKAIFPDAEVQGAVL